MHAAEIVMRNAQSNRRGVMLQLYFEKPLVNRANPRCCIGSVRFRRSI